MPKISKTKLAETDFGSIFDHMGVEDPQKKAKKTSGPTTEDLAEQIKALNAKYDEQLKLNQTLMSQPYVPVSDIGPGPGAKVQEINLDDLPDPVLYPREYAAELGKRTLANIRAQQEAERQSAASSQAHQDALDQRVQGLWQDFQKGYEDLAKNEDQVAFIAEKVSREAQARGVDIDKYMFGPGRKQYLADVADRLRTTFPVAQADTDEGDDEVSTQTEPAPRQREAPQRTAGMFGGQQSGGKPEKSQTQITSMTKDIQDMQRVSGLF